tara:strand:+ start:58 stop:189 length:132 start_codon:yes stop_codon:yes gene_type:complete
MREEVDALSGFGKVIDNILGISEGVLRWVCNAMCSPSPGRVVP